MGVGGTTFNYLIWSSLLIQMDLHLELLSLMVVSILTVKFQRGDAKYFLVVPIFTTQYATLAHTIWIATPILSFYHSCILYISNSCWYIKFINNSNLHTEGKMTNAKFNIYSKLFHYLMLLSFTTLFLYFQVHYLTTEWMQCGYTLSGHTLQIGGV